MSARDRILARLTQSAPAVTPDPPDVQRWARAQRLDESLTQRIARLCESLEAAHAETHLTDAGSWRRKLQEIVEAKKLRRLLIGADMELELTGASPCQLVRVEQIADHWRDQLFNDIDASLTRVKSAIAATGTPIVWPDAKEPRLMSLVPPTHLVVLDAATIHADFSAAIAAENWADHLPANALLISGPSKTADIQQTMAYGAHGPRELIVLVVQPEGSGR